MDAKNRRQHHQRSSSPSTSAAASSSSTPPPLVAEQQQQQQLNCDQQQQQQQQVKWACQHCTYLNWPRSLKCVQCLSPRNRRQTALSPRSSPPGSLTYQHANRQNSSNNERNAALRAANNASPVAAEACQAAERGKWACAVCTYDNWPRASACVLCGARQPPLNEDALLSDHHVQQIRGSNRDTPSPPAAASLSPDNNQHHHHQQQQQQRQRRSFSPAATGSSVDGASSSTGASANNYDYERRMRQLRRRMRESDWTFLTACMGVVEGDANPVEAYLSAGGDPAR